VRFRPHVWVPALELHLRTSCIEAADEYGARRELPKNYEEFETNAFRHFDDRIKSVEQGLSDGDDRTNLHDSVELLKREFRSGSRPDLQNMARDLHVKLLQKVRPPSS